VADVVGVDGDGCRLGRIVQLAVGVAATVIGDDRVVGGEVAC